MNKVFIIIGGILLWLGSNITTAYGSSVLTVSATVLSKSNCKFDSKNAAIDFGLIDPDSANDVTATTTTTFICHGSAPQASFLITQNGGLNATGPAQNRMGHLSAPGEYLPYTLQLSDASATVPKNERQTLTITGTVDTSDFQNARAGSFRDTVILSINP